MPKHSFTAGEVNRMKRTLKRARNNRKKMNKLKYVQAFVLKIVQCAKCTATLNANTIELYVNPDEMMLKAESAPIVHKLDCVSDKDIIVIFDTAFVPVAILEPLIAGGNSAGDHKLS